MSPLTTTLPLSLATTLILCILPANSFLPESPFTSLVNDEYVSLNKEDVQMNLIVNQLAILKLVNNISPVSVDEREGGVVEEVRRLREDLMTKLQDNQDTLQVHLATLINNSLAEVEMEREEECVAAVKRDVVRVREDQATLREELATTLQELATLKRQARDSERRSEEESDEEVRRLASDLAALNTSLTHHATDAERKRREMLVRVGDEVATVRENQDSLQATLTTLHQHLKQLHQEPNVTCPSCHVEGEVHVHDNCSISICRQGCQYLHPDYQDYSLTSTSLGGKCVHYVLPSKTWDAARDNCVALGGDLVVTNNLREAVEFVVGVGRDAWVGVKGRAWLDGQPVTAELWAPGQPNDGPDDCGFIRTNSHKLRDAPCTSSGSSLCLSGVSYD